MKKTTIISVVAAFVTLVFSSCGSSSEKAGNLSLFPYGDGNEKTGYVDMNGKVAIEPQYGHAYLFRDGIALVYNGHFGASANFGYIKENGDCLIDPKYLAATQFSEGLAWVLEENSCPKAIDTKGKVQIEAKEAQYVCCFSEGLAAVMQPGRYNQLKWGFLNKNGEVAIEPRFWGVDRFSEGLSAAAMEKDAWGYIDVNGNMVISGKYKAAKPFRNGMAAVSENGYLWGVIDKQGKEVLPCEYSLLEQDGDLFLVKKGKYVGWIDKTGNYVIETSYCNAHPFAGAELAAVSDESNRYGYIDKKGNLVIDLQYSEAYPFFGKKAFVETSGQLYLIDEKGKSSATKGLMFGPANGKYFVNEVLAYSTSSYPYAFTMVKSVFKDPEMLENTRITAEGVGPVKMGMKLSDIPKSVRYLYDSVVVEHYDDEGEQTAFVTFYLRGIQMFSARSWDNKTVTGIGVGFESAAAGNPICFQSDGHEYRIQDSFSGYVAEHHPKMTRVESSGGEMSYYDVQGLKVYSNQFLRVLQFEIGEYIQFWD